MTELPRLSCRAISLGAGVQSTALLLMAELGHLDSTPDVAIFADTGWEPAAVYEHLAWLERTVKRIKIVRVSAGDLRADAIAAAFTETSQAQPSASTLTASPSSALSAAAGPSRASHNPKP